MLKFIAEKISTHMLSLLLASLTPIATAFAIYFRHEVVLQVQQASPEALALIIVGLGLMSLALIALSLYLIPSFKYLPKYQFYQHLLNGLYYCPTCRNKKPLSPLRYEKTGWRCPFKECGKFYKDPDYIAPEIDVAPIVNHWPKPGK